MLHRAHYWSSEEANRPAAELPVNDWNKARRIRTPSAEVETRAAGASLAPGAQPGLPQMVVTMVGAHNYRIACRHAQDRRGRRIRAKQGS